MSVNVYLYNEIRNHPDFKNEYNCIRLKKISLFESDGGRLHFRLFDKNDYFPSELETFVEEISAHEELLIALSRRETGIYKHESAEAEVKVRNEKYLIRVKGKKIEDVRFLLHAIQTGSIRPAESYEGPQKGLSQKELWEQLLTEREERHEMMSQNASEKHYMRASHKHEVDALLKTIEELKRSKLSRWFNKILNIDFLA